MNKLNRVISNNCPLCDKEWGITTVWKLPRDMAALKKEHDNEHKKEE